MPKRNLQPADTVSVDVVSGDVDPGSVRRHPLTGALTFSHDPDPPRPLPLASGSLPEGDYDLDDVDGEDIAKRVLAKRRNPLNVRTR